MFVCAALPLIFNVSVLCAIKLKLCMMCYCSRGNFRLVDAMAHLCSPTVVYLGINGFEALERNIV